ncbi:MAG: hypothetical protein KC731_36075, partial [Myxococcales bacterium]|nr:hypothetical protein [Myxococcales bacterium]
LFARRPPKSLLPLLFGVSALIHGGELALYRIAPKVAAITLFLHVAALGATTLAGVWAVVNESFDPHRAKRAVARITLGGPAGGIVGGLLGLGMAQFHGVDAGLGALILLALASLGVTVVMARRAPAVHKEREIDTGSSWRDGYVWSIGGLVGAVAALSAVIDYWVSARASAAFDGDAGLMSFFALLHMTIGVLAFVIQVAFARMSLERLGIAGTTALLPGVALLLTALPLLTPVVWAVAVLRGATGTIEASLYRAGHELFYTPLPTARLRRVKMFVAVGCDRVGTALGAGVVSGLVLWFPGDRGLATVLAAIAGGCMLLCLQLHQGYIRALADSLRRGVVKLTPGDVFDAATRRTLAETQKLDRAALLAAIEQRYTSLESEDPEPPRSSRNVAFDNSLVGLPASPDLLGDFARGDDPLVEAIVTLRSGSVEAVRALLEEPIERAMAPLVIAHLARQSTARSAVRALRRDVDRFIGLLVDVLLDPKQDVVIRRRIPRVLEHSADPRAIAGLLDALVVENAAVRMQAALALLELTKRFPEAKVEEAPVLRAVRNDLDRLSRGEGREEVQRCVEFCMVVLSLILDREPLQLAYRALRGEDQRLVGTALEYFETVLPEDIRERSAPLLLSLSETPQPRRSQHELKQELLQSRSA